MSESEYELSLTDYSNDFEERESQLEHDLQTYIGKLAYKDEIFTGEFDVYLFVDILTTISSITGTAWGIDTSAPIIIKLKVFGDDYRSNWKTPAVCVYQVDEESNLYQLECILQRFLDCVWTLGKQYPWDQSYMDSHEEDVTKYLEFIDDPCDAIILYRLFKEDIEKGVEFYTKREEENIFNLIHEYLLYRLPTLCGYCLHCDEIPFFMRGRSMELLKPFVCGNPLCNYQLSQLKMGADIAGAISGSANLTHILALTSVTAALSEKWREKIFNPFPALISHDDPTELYLDPNNRDYERLANIANAIPLEREAYVMTNESEFTSLINAVHPYGTDLLRWILNSNRAHITDIPEPLVIPNTGTTEQYLMLLDSPAKEEAFQQLKAEYGTVYAFHGTPIMNYHSILRGGLQNASGTKLQRHGTAHGAGIYLSPSLSFSLGYCRNNGYRCLALCEVINDGINKKTGSIWTISDASKVCTRFLFVYKPVRTSSKRLSTSFLSTSDETIASINAIYEYYSMT